jgi:type IV secretory pathway TrbD component
MATEENTAVRHVVYRSINKPLLFCGVDRRYFFFAVVFGAAVFNLLGSLFGGLAVFGVGYVFASWATKTDPQILPIILKPVINPERFHTVYDPGKLRLSEITVEQDTTL